MQTEDLLKVKFVLVCALASEVESGRHIGIPLEQLMEAIGITALPCPATAGSALDLMAEVVNGVPVGLQSRASMGFARAR